MKRISTSRHAMQATAASIALLANSFASAAPVPIGPAAAAPAPVASAPAAPLAPPVDFATFCQTGRLQAVAASLASTKVTVGKIEESPSFPTGVRYVAAKGALPAYCQVQGRFVTNAATGKTANFLATLPANWNGKYLQLGCSGHCGNFAVSDPSASVITITAQGYPGQIMAKGYAAFATDEGHVGFAAGRWAIKGRGQVDEDAITDFLYRADKVLATMGKEFTSAFYADLTGTPRSVERAYFDGCSGGGRDALVAANYFPEAFDGIIAGSPYGLAERAFHGLATSLATLRTPDARVTPGQMTIMDAIVKAQCDDVDGVKDGLIQNPAACGFDPARDLPRCAGDQPVAQCFTKAQVETISVALSATVDEHGTIVQPGFSVSEFAADFQPVKPPADPAAVDPWPDGESLDGQFWALGNAAVKVFTHKNDPAFSSRSIVSFRSGGPGPVTGFHSVVPSAEVARVRTATRLGLAHLPDQAARLIRQDRKLLIWQNFSDEKLTPYTTTNYYKALAKRYGGYAKLQRNIRLFMIPGASHCSINGVGPNNFDALTAIENWVEHDQAPEALAARLFDRRSPIVDWSKPALRSMPLCAFPEMARYKGTGDVNVAASWSCPAGDRSLLKIGPSGREAGAL